METACKPSPCRCHILLALCLSLPYRHSPNSPTAGPCEYPPVSVLHGSGAELTQPPTPPGGVRAEYTGHVQWWGDQKPQFAEQYMYSRHIAALLVLCFSHSFV